MVILMSKSLLTVPNESLAQINRVKQTFENKHAYTLPQKHYIKQYSNLYYTRLNQLRPRLLAKCEDSWNVPFVAKIVSLSMGKACFIIGTVYVDAPLKPNILDEITREQWVQAPPPREKYTSDHDKIMLEDESGRVALSGEVLKSELLTTGMIIGILGSENRDGSFSVLDLMYPEIVDPQPALPFNGSWIAFCSGLDITDRPDLRIQLLADFLTGELGSESVFIHN
jgi:DNA polymerase delta subunit 2